MQKGIHIYALQGLPEYQVGDDIANTIIVSAQETLGGLETDDVLVVTQKIVSKSEGMTINLSTIEPGVESRSLAERTGKDPRLVELILRESKSLVRVEEERGIIISETYHGFVCANAGIDSSNIPGEDNVCLLPRDSNKSARRIREQLINRTNLENIAVLISDTFGRPWRDGHLNFAIGSSGIRPIHDYRDTIDAVGKVMRVSMTATADILAAAADLVSGKATNTPISLIRGLDYETGLEDARMLLRDVKKDLFR